MNAGKKVLMEFSNGESMPVSTSDIAAVQKAAKSQGGWARVANRTGMMGQIMPRQIAQSWADNAPLAGSVLGSTAGGVVGAGMATAAAAPYAAPYAATGGRMAGGVAGGMLGQAAREGAYRAMGLGDAPGTVAGEGAAQAIVGPLGEGLAGLSGLAGRTALRSSIVSKGREGIRAVGEMVKERIPVGGLPGPSELRHIPVVGPMLVRGSKVAGELMGERTAARNMVNEQATQQGVTIPRKTAEDAIKGLITKASKSMGDDAEVKFLKRQLASWQRRNLDQLRPTDVQPILSRFDAKSKPVFDAINRGVSLPSEAHTIRATYMKEVADALRGAMREAVPGHQEVSGKLSRAIGANSAIRAAEAMPSAARFFGRSAVGTGIGSAAGALANPEDRIKGAEAGALTGLAALNSPPAMSRAGLALTDPYLLALMRQTPRFVLSDKGQQ